MKILQVIPYFNPKKGGDVAVAYQISKYLSQMGHDVTIITSNHEFDTNYAKSFQNVNVIPFDCLINLNKLIITPAMNKWLNNEIEGFDIIHLHNFRTYQNSVVQYYAKKYGVSYILQAHGALPRIIEKKGLKYLFDVFSGFKILRDASKVIAVSNIEVDQYLKMGVPKDKIVIIPNGIDVDSFNDLPEKGTFRKQYGISEKYIILFLGRLHEIKGIDFLIKSYAELKNELNDVVLVLAGSDDGYKAKAEILINDLNLTNEVRFIGHVDGADKLAAYVDADVLVYPSIFEIFGLVPFEAIMCGTPIIVTDDCGCGELVRDANCGDLVKYGDIKTLKDKIRNILENQKQSKSLVCNGKNYIIQNLAYDRIGDFIKIIYGTHPE